MISACLYKMAETLPLERRTLKTSASNGLVKDIPGLSKHWVEVHPRSWVHLTPLPVDENWSSSWIEIATFVREDVDHLLRYNFDLVRFTI